MEKYIVSLKNSGCVGGGPIRKYIVFQCIERCVGGGYPCENTQLFKRIGAVWEQASCENTYLFYRIRDVWDKETHAKIRGFLMEFKVY